MYFIKLIFILKNNKIGNRMARHNNLNDMHVNTEKATLRTTSKDDKIYVN